jgi:glycosyltransferase involved in cell wall biosynthesis
MEREELRPAAPPRLDLVSPLPPVRSGIADYCADLLPHLAAVADVRLIRLPGLPIDPGIAARWPAADAGALGEGGRLPLYQMGNNRYHEGVRALALARPGVLTLHDLVLHHLLLDVTLGRGEFDGYRESLTRDHGWVGEAAALAKRWGAYGEAPVFALAANRTLLRRQRGILVHSEWAAGMVREEDPELRVRVVPMGVPLPPAEEADGEAPRGPGGAAESGPGGGAAGGPARTWIGEAGRAWRRRHGLPVDRPVLGSFGFQTPIKRTTSALAALAAPGLEGVHLLIAGESAQSLDLAGEARRAGVAERVHVTGFLPFGELAAAIAAVDLCINLRYPTAGETSASLLRVFAAGRPAVVSDYAQFADLPAAIAPRVPLGDGEGEALAALVRELLAAPGRLRAMGAAAREHVRRRHAPERAAQAVAAACGEWAELDPPGDAAPWVPAPGSIAWGRLSGELEVDGAELPWPAGERRRLRIRLRNRGEARWSAGARGPGGVAVVVKLIAGGRDLLADRDWLALPRDLEPGAEMVLETEVRRPAGPPSPRRPAGMPRLPVPPGTIRLWIEPHLFGGVAFSAMGGPRWERDL